MSFSKTITSLFLSILKILKLISYFSLEMASRRLAVITRSEKDTDGESDGEIKVLLNYS